MPPTNIVVEKSLCITKTSFDSKTGAMKFRMVGSDVDPDVFGEKMSLELFNDFTTRIEKAIPVVEPFKSVLSEKSGWSGGMPYVSVAHYKSGIGGANIPADTEKVYVDGEKLKAIAVCRNNSLGQAVYKALKADFDGTSEYDDKIRVSIGFLDLSHSHGDFVFERTTLEKQCPMCENGIGNKVYLKGQLVHLALTRKPANPRTDTEVDMAEIKTQKEDAESIVGKAETELIEVNKSTTEAEDILVVKSEKPVPAEDEELEEEKPKDKKKKEEMKSEVVTESIPEPDAPVTEVVAPVEKSALDVAVDSLKSHLLQVKSLPRDEALKELQPDFELVAKAVQNEFAPPAAVIRAEISPELVGLLGELKTAINSVATEVAVLKSQMTVGAVQPRSEVPSPRNLQIERSNVLPDLATMKPMSIKELALRSVQG